MNSATGYAALADGVLLVHACIVAFVIASPLTGLCWLALGKPAWAARTATRYAHIGVLLVVVLQAWTGRLCPLTIWENQLRERSGEAGYDRGFFADLVHRLLFYDATMITFAFVYSLFGVVSLLIWWRVASIVSSSHSADQISP